MAYSEEMFCFADRVAEMSRAMYEEYSHDRKAIAMGLKGNPLAYIGFDALKTDKPGRVLLAEKPLLNLKRLIKEYPENVFGKE